MGIAENKVTLWFQLVFVIVLAGSFSLVWSFTIFKNYVRENDRRTFADDAKEYVRYLKKVTNETGYQQFLEEHTGYGEAYICVMNRDGSVRFPSKVDDVSHQICKQSELRPNTVKVDTVEEDDDDGYTSQREIIYVNSEPMYQEFYEHTVGDNLLIIIKQELLTLDNLWSLQHNKIIFFIPLLLFMLLVVIVYWVLNPLRRIGKVVACLKTDGCDYISVNKYPRELALLANVLNSFISATRKSRQEAIEARRKIDVIRGKILSEAINLTIIMEHQSENILRKAVMHKTVNDSPEKLKDELRLLKNRAMSVINSTDNFLKEICTLGQNDNSQQDETANIHDILRNSISIYKEVNPNHYFCVTGLESIQDVKAYVVPQKLERICMELLINATKYSASEVLMQVGRSDNKIWIKIHNDGDKFPEENRESMFDYGVRAKHNREVGTGLGLFFVKQAATLMGCIVELRDSDVLSGACVYLEVPLSHNAPLRTPISH